MSAQSANSIITHRSFMAILTVLVTVMIGLAGMRLAGVAPNDGPPQTTVEQSVVLRVEDGPQGSVIVRNGQTGTEIQTFKRAEGTFVRAVLRALVNDRRHKGTTIQGDFRLERHEGGRLYLIDEVTGKRLTLNAYGPDNSAVFAAFISNQ